LNTLGNLVKVDDLLQSFEDLGTLVRAEKRRIKEGMKVPSRVIALAKEIINAIIERYPRQL
jgi:hypothetical protein